jgi:hypothetical protein
MNVYTKKPSFPSGEMFVVDEFARILIHYFIKSGDIIFLLGKCVVVF